MTAQLIYGSADRVHGRAGGGWGVLTTTPDLTPEATEALLALTSVSMPSGLPQFPSSEQLGARPVRFRLDPLGDTYAACRSIEAGTDHTGRPGNVVSHCALIPAAAQARPVDWFFVDGWVAPYGPHQVASATPPTTLAAPHGWEGTAEWLRADPQRTARIRWIVDVVFTMLLDTERVLLVAPTSQEAARWASVLSWLMDSRMAELVRIRIGEDPSSVVEQLAKVPVLAAVSSPPDPGVLRGLPPIDVTWDLDPERARTVGEWVLPTGHRFPASPLSDLVVDLVFADPATVAAVFEKRDQLHERYLAGRHKALTANQLLLLQAAWLLTPGAQDLAREEPIRVLLAALNPDLLGWEDIASLAAEVGQGPALDDVYGGVGDEPPAPQATGRQPTPLQRALIACATLAKVGVDVEALVMGEQFQLAGRSPEVRQAAEAVLAVLAAQENVGEEL